MGSSSVNSPPSAASRISLPGRVAELADALDLGSSAARREGSSPSLPTRENYE
jgi:hypothetical protein